MPPNLHLATSPTFPGSSKARLSEMPWCCRVTPWSIKASPEQGRLGRMGAIPFLSHQRGRAEAEVPWGGCEDVSPSLPSLLPIPTGPPQCPSTSTVTPWSKPRVENWGGVVGLFIVQILHPSVFRGPFLELTHRSLLTDGCTCLPLVSLTLLKPGEPLRCLFRIHPSASMFWKSN